MTTDQWIALAAVLITALIGWLPFRAQIRRDARDRDERSKQDTRQAVLDATAPLLADRDYWRNRCDQLEDQLRSRDDRP